MVPQESALLFEERSDEFRAEISTSPILPERSAARHILALPFVCQKVASCPLVTKGRKVFLWKKAK